MVANLYLQINNYYLCCQLPPKTAKNSHLVSVACLLTHRHIAIRTKTSQNGKS